jgi:hypothetical protein
MRSAYQHGNLFSLVRCETIYQIIQASQDEAVAMPLSAVWFREAAMSNRVL